MNLSAISLPVGNFKQLSMNRRIEVAKFEPGPTFEKTINEIKHNHLKIIASTSINISAITSFNDNIEQLIINRIILKYKNSDLNQHFKIILMRSKIII